MGERREQIEPRRWQKMPAEPPAGKQRVACLNFTARRNTIFA